MLDKGFVVRVILTDAGVDDEKDIVEQIFVTENEPDLDGIRNYARSAGWPSCELVVFSAPLLGGDGGTEISQWITDANRRGTQNDPTVARMNELERNLSSLAKHMNAGFADIKALLTGAAASPSIKPVVVRAERATPDFDEVLAPADEPIPTRRRDMPMRTREMNGNGDFRSNSMAVVGGGAGSKIFSVEAGVDDEGLPKQAGLPRVGETLHKGTKLGE